MPDSIARNVLVVGASRGLGLELVRQYRADGAKALKLDVADAASASGLAWQIDGEAFDTVFFVAGVIGDGAPAMQPPTQADFDAVMHTNVLGAMRVLPTVAEALAPARGGAIGARIGVLSSRMGSIGSRSANGHWLYRASKAAVNSVLKDAAIALEGRALCVAFHPGWVRTDMGGSGADIDVADSVAGLRRTLAGLDAAASGSFLNYDGAPIAW